MARKSAPILPGQSRSAACLLPITDSPSLCHRLAGHRKGACRGTLSRATSASPTEPTVVGGHTLGGPTNPFGVRFCPECWVPESSWRLLPCHQAQSAKPTVTAQTTAKPKGAKAGKRQLRCRIVKAGVRCSRAYGHKKAGTRHSFAVVRQLPEVGPKGRDLQVVKGKSSRRGNYVASSKPSSRLA